MPTLALRSLWEQPAQTLSTSVTTLQTSDVVPNFPTVGTPVTISLFSQIVTNVIPTAIPNNPPGINPQDLPFVPVLVIRMPDNTIVNLTTATSPAITHTSGSGTYSVVMNTYQVGLYRWSWNLNGQPLSNGELWVQGPVAP